MIGFGSTSGGIPTTSNALKHQRAHELLSSQRMSLTLQLASGEQLSYSWVGDSEGVICIWFGGPTESRMIAGLYDDMCRELGLKLFFIDRPGRGARYRSNC